MDKYDNFDGAIACRDLTDEERGMVAELVGVYEDCRHKNEKRMAYYRDKSRPTDLGQQVPPRFKRMHVGVGWAAKAVDMLAARCILQGFTADGDAADEVRAISEANEIQSRYEMALPSTLVHGVGFWTVSPDRRPLFYSGAEHGGVVINYHDAESSSAVWDFRRNRVKYGMVIEDWGLVGNRYQPTAITLHTDGSIIQIEQGQRGRWTASRNENAVGRCLMESMAYRPMTPSRPFGKSRISEPVMTITDEMQRATINLAMHDEMHASPMKYLLGLPQKQFKAIMEDKEHWYSTKLLASTANANGANPEVGMLQATSPDGHIAFVEKLAQNMAAETYIPAAALGVNNAIYTSSEALRAQCDNLIIEAEHVVRATGKAMQNVMRMAMAMSQGKGVDGLTEDEMNVTASFADPAMPTAAAMSDAMLKQVSFLGEGFANSDVCLGQLGYDEDQQRRIQAARNQATAASVTAALFAKPSGEQ